MGCAPRPPRWLPPRPAHRPVRRPGRRERRPGAPRPLRHQRQRPPEHAIPAFGWRQLEIDDLALEGVPKGNRTAGLFRGPVDQARDERPLDRSGRRGHPRHLAQARQWKRMIDHRQHLEHRPGICTQLDQLVAYCGRERRGHREATSPGSADGRRLTQKGPQVQGVPAGLVVQALRRLARQGTDPHRLRERRHVINAQSLTAEGSGAGRRW